MNNSYRFVVTVKIPSEVGGYQSHYFDEFLTDADAFALAQTIVRDGWTTSKGTGYVMYSPSSIHSVSFS